MNVNSRLATLNKFRNTSPSSVVLRQPVTKVLVVYDVVVKSPDVSQVPLVINYGELQFANQHPILRWINIDARSPNRFTQGCGGIRTPVSSWYLPRESERLFFFFTYELIFLPVYRQPLRPTILAPASSSTSSRLQEAMSKCFAPLNASTSKQASLIL
jgi:hypothetical protein